MKSLRFSMMAVMVFISFNLLAQTQTDTIKVYGNCGMCKKRIEKAASLNGVTSVSWNPDSKSLIVSYNTAQTSNNDIQKAIAAVGHDTEKYTAEAAVYNKLPGCCLYERKQEEKHKH